MTFFRGDGGGGPLRPGEEAVPRAEGGPTWAWGPSDVEAAPDAPERGRP